MVVVDGDTEVVIGEVTAIGLDLGTVDALARVHLFARRLGCAVRLRDASSELVDLLSLAGLDDLLVENPR